MYQDNFLINIIDTIVYSRPLPNREYDQIYMRALDMVKQAKFVEQFVSEKKIVFLGDGDGMSVLLSALNFGINSIGLYDFDERILLNTKKQVNNLNIKIPIQCNLYNVIMPIENSDLNKYDFFYINPPYGSYNEGLSCRIWIDRCIDLCTDQCSGCIIIPYDSRLSWTIHNMHKIQLYLLDKGFIIRDMISYMHQYHLEDNPNLKSATLIVEKISDSTGDYSGEFLDKELVKNLYGRPRIIPKYITMSEENMWGQKDYSWDYGKEGFWNI